MEAGQLRKNYFFWSSENKIQSDPYEKLDKDPIFIL